MLCSSWPFYYQTHLPAKKFGFLSIIAGVMQRCRAGMYVHSDLACRHRPMWVGRHTFKGVQKPQCIAWWHA